MSMSDRPRPTARVPYARANCTHVSMDMIYGSFVCDLCQSRPSMGWLYECQQDRLQTMALSQKIHGFPTGSEHSTIRDLGEHGFSSSIMSQVEQDLYTDDQIRILKQQKTVVNRLIECQLELTRGEGDVNSTKEFSPHPNITVRRRKQRNGKKASSTTIAPSALRANAICTLRCCHKCRPYYRDRVYASLNGVVDNIDAAYAQTPFSGLKLLNPQVVQHLGLEKRVTSSSEAASPTSSFWTTSSSAYSPTRMDTDNSHIRPEIVSEEVDEHPTHQNLQVGWATDLRELWLTSLKDALASSSPAITRVQPLNPITRTSTPLTSSSETKLDPPTNGLVGRLMSMTRSASQRVLCPNNKTVFQWPLGKKTKACPQVVLAELPEDGASPEPTSLKQGPVTIRRVSASDTDADRDTSNTADNGSDTESSASATFPADQAIALSEIAVEEHVPDIITQR